MPRTKGGGRGTGGGRGARDRSGIEGWVASHAVRTALFVALGLSAAFAVSAVAGWLGGDPDPAAEARRALDDPTDVRVEVLNAAGKEGLAWDATHALRTAGFDVVYFGNAESFDLGRSVVLDRVGRPERAHAVAAALGIDSVASVPDPKLLLDATVLLGTDWPPADPERRGFGARLDALLGR